MLFRYKELRTDEGHIEVTSASRMQAQPGILTAPRRPPIIAHLSFDSDVADIYRDAAASLIPWSHKLPRSYASHRLQSQSATSFTGKESSSGPVVDNSSTYSTEPVSWLNRRRRTSSPNIGKVPQHATALHHTNTVDLKVRSGNDALDSIIPSKRKASYFEMTLLGKMPLKATSPTRCQNLRTKERKWSWRLHTVADPNAQNVSNGSEASVKSAGTILKHASDAINALLATPRVLSVLGTWQVRVPCKVACTA